MRKIIPAIKTGGKAKGSPRYRDPGFDGVLLKGFLQADEGLGVAFQKIFGEDDFDAQGVAFLINKRGGDGEVGGEGILGAEFDGAFDHRTRH